MNNAELDILVIGGGCVGSAILKEVSTLGIGQLGLIDYGRNTKSATASSAGMMRVFHENMDHVELALGHHHRMKNMENINPPNGSLYFFHRRRYPQYETILKKLDEAGYPFEVLTTSRGKDRFPEFQWSPEEWAIYEPLGTHYNPKIFSEFLLNQSIGRGAQVIDDFEVQRICPYKGRFRVCGPNGTVITKSLILSGGARFLPRLKELGLSIPLERKLIKSFEAQKNDDHFVLPNFFDRETLSFGRLGNESTVVFSDVEGKKIKVKKWNQHFKENTSEDCYAPERKGILGQIPGHANLFLATGWGGTAFKFSLEIGSRMSAIIERNILEKGSLA